jgi:hypothetical protein
MLGLVASLFGIDLLGFVLRFWPVAISAVGLAFVLPPLLVRGKRGLGGLFIPGVPILVTAGILLVASVLDGWAIWSWLWPMEVQAIALGFLIAALYMDVSGLLIPATIIGLNGLVFQFCAFTGLWGWWSVLWTVEPLSVGLALLLAGARNGSAGVLKAGMILCAVAAAGFLLMIAVVAGGWLFRLVGPALVILTGLALLGWGLARGRLLPRPATK